jgi:hypothetical protein
MSRRPVTVHFSQTCWRFLYETQLPSQLVTGIRAMLDGTSSIEITRPFSETLYAVALLRSQVSDLSGWLAAIRDALGKDDPRRRICEECIDNVSEAIRRSRPAFRP